MLNLPRSVDYPHILLTNDNDAPYPEVVATLIEVFGKSEADAKSLADEAQTAGKADCGVYPPPVATALLDSAKSRLTEAGHPMMFILRTAPDGNLNALDCRICGEAKTSESDVVKGKSGSVCVRCVALAADHISSLVGTEKKFKTTDEALDQHFVGIPKDRLTTTSRQFPGHMRADAQRAIDGLFATAIRFFGLYEQHRYESLTFAALMRGGNSAISIAPAQYDEVDIGNQTAVKCLKNGL